MHHPGHRRQLRGKANHALGAGHVRGIGSLGSHSERKCASDVMDFGHGLESVRRRILAEVVQTEVHQDERWAPARVVLRQPLRQSLRGMFRAHGSCDSHAPLQ
ncbi:hypothetical protein D3C73_1097080 [compost metagenome]